MLTQEVEMTAATRDAVRKAAGRNELTLTEKVMLIAGFVAWAIVGVLVVGAVAVGFR